MGKADSVFEVIGPIMIGPSSSHTAAAVRIGQISRAILGEPVRKVIIQLHGSYALTGKGHGTDKAVIADWCILSIPLPWSDKPGGPALKTADKRSGKKRG